jgi:hypothetical protein
MKYWIYITLFGLSVLAGFALCSRPAHAGEYVRNPNFHFNDCVQVVDGFYKGCHGRVKDMSPGGFTYEVSMVCKNGSTTIQNVDLDSLKPLNDKACKDS